MRVLVLFFLSALCLTANAQSLKIGFIDTKQVIVNLTQYKNSVDEISREFEPRKQELLDLFKHIELLRANIKLGDIRMSAGFGFAYLSPIGSIGGFISTPVLKKSGDITEDFGLSIGTGF